MQQLLFWFPGHIQDLETRYPDNSKCTTDNLYFNSIISDRSPSYFFLSCLSAIYHSLLVFMVGCERHKALVNKIGLNLIIIVIQMLTILHIKWFFWILWRKTKIIYQHRRSINNGVSSLEQRIVRAQLCSISTQLKLHKWKQSDSLCTSGMAHWVRQSSLSNIPLRALQRTCADHAAGTSSSQLPQHPRE